MDDTEAKLLLDVGVGRKVEEWFKGTDYDVKSIRDLDPRMSDIEILKIAVSGKRLLITMDKDFGELVYKSKRPHKGVILLRLEDERALEKINTIKAILEKFLPEIIDKFSVYKDGKLRIRK